MSARTYPIFVKTKAVTSAKVHPLAFQTYKGVIVFVASVLLVSGRYFLTNEKQALEPTYVWTWWAAAAATVSPVVAVSTIFYNGHCRFLANNQQ